MRAGEALFQKFRRSHGGILGELDAAATFPLTFAEKFDGGSRKNEIRDKMRIFFDSCEDDVRMRRSG